MKYLKSYGLFSKTIAFIWYNFKLLLFKYNSVIKMSLGKPVIQMYFMDDEMKDFAISEAQKALDISNSEKVNNFICW